MNFTPRPAPVAKRVLAGVVDAACILVLGGIAFFAPLLAKGAGFPMWGVLAVLLGYSVLPIAYFKKTFGLAIAGLEVVGKTGHALDLGNALFRELLGRGWFPAAYLFTMLGGLLAAYLGIGASVAPPVLASVMLVVSSVTVTLAAVGHLVVLGRPDQRSLADLISGSFVVEAPALPLPTDPDEVFEAKQQRARVLRNVIIVQVLLALGVYVSPLFFTLKAGESPAHRGQRLKIEALQAKFEKSPQSPSLTKELRGELFIAGRDAEAKAVLEKHRQALSLEAVKREEALRAEFERTKDRASAQRLIQLLEEEDRVAEARDVYAAWLGPDAPPDELASFGHWLATNGLTDEAVTVLTKATALDPRVPYGHTLLGVSLQRLGRLKDAQVELELALLDEPGDEDARGALAEVEAEVAPLTAADKKKLKARVDAWPPRQEAP